MPSEKTIVVHVQPDWFANDPGRKIRALAVLKNDPRTDDAVLGSHSFEIKTCLPAATAADIEKIRDFRDQLLKIVNDTL